MTINDLCAIVLQYDEPGWTAHTLACCKAAGIRKIVMADRDGVGNMSKAFNRALTRNGVFRYKYVWFLTNVGFEPYVPTELMGAFGAKTAAVHPVHNSDHVHLRPYAGSTPKEVPFVEFTAPMFRTAFLQRIGKADEQMPYWGMDLDWSYRAKQKGYNLMVSPAPIEHTYLLRIENKHPISDVRNQLRRIWYKPTEQRLLEKYGARWAEILWPR